MKAIVKLVVVLLATLWPSALWADPAVTISWPGSYGRGSLKLTLIANDGTGPVTYTKTVPYGEFSTAGSLAGALGAHISMSPDWPVWAKGSPDGTVLMKARGSGITISNLSVCAIPSGAGDCGSTPSGANLAGNPSNVVPAGVSLDGALYGYSITDTNGNSGYDAAGNITAYQDTVNQRWTLAYDALNRLASASQYYYTAAFPTPAAPGGGMQQFFCWVYDSFGNRQRQAVSGTPFSDFSSCNPPGSDSVTVDQQYAGGTNRLTSAPGLAFVYDDAGNITEDGRFKYLYNEEGKLCAVMANATAPYGATGYLYNAEGQRVAKGTLSSFSCDFSSNGFTMTNEYIPGPDGNTLTEVAWSGSASTPVRTYAYAGGQLAATLDSNGTHYQLSDWLGSRRLQQKDGSTPSEVKCGNLPFGDGQTCADAVPQHFTGKERDNESGLDNFGARYYGSSMGRFMSPDPGWFFATNPADPQSWNIYAYARNNPLSFVDPDGYDCVYLNNAGTDVDRDRDGNPTGIDQNSNSGECGKNGGYWVDGTVTNVTLYTNSNDVGLSGMWETGASAGQQTDSYYSNVSANGPGGANLLSLDDSAFGDYRPLQNVLYYHQLDPWQAPSRLFGSHWCGAGGGGVPVSNLDAACKAHDQCFDAAGISAANNVGGGHMTLQQAAAAQGCNAALAAAAAANPNDPGSSRVRAWLKHGDQLLVITGSRIDGKLAAGTAVR